jgi:RNA polymerase sigma factor (TIGR02999 family)
MSLSVWCAGILYVMNDITQILARVESGDQDAVHELLSSVYAELRRLASAKMAREPADHTLQATALVHEAFLRLVGSENDVSWQNRRHFFGAAAEAMRRVLVDAARRRKRRKRGGELERTFIDMAEIPQLQAGQDFEAVDAALSRFAEVDAQKAEVVKLRFLAGLTIEQTGEVLGISTATVERYWTYARAWLFRELSKSDDG